MKRPVTICLAGFIFGLVMAFVLGNSVGFACGYNCCKKEQVRR